MSWWQRLFARASGLKDAHDRQMVRRDELMGALGLSATADGDVWEHALAEVQRLVALRDAVRRWIIADARTVRERDVADGDLGRVWREIDPSNPRRARRK